MLVYNNWQIIASNRYTVYYISMTSPGNQHCKNESVHCTPKCIHSHTFASKYTRSGAIWCAMHTTVLRWALLQWVCYATWQGKFLQSKSPHILGVFHHNLVASNLVLLILDSNHALQKLSDKFEQYIGGMELFHIRWFVREGAVFCIYIYIYMMSDWLFKFCEFGISISSQFLLISLHLNHWFRHAYVCMCWVYMKLFC